MIYLLQSIEEFVIVRRAKFTPILLKSLISSNGLHLSMIKGAL